MGEKLIASVPLVRDTLAVAKKIIWFCTCLYIFSALASTKLRLWNDMYFFIVLFWDSNVSAVALCGVALFAFWELFSTFGFDLWWLLSVFVLSGLSFSLLFGYLLLIYSAFWLWCYFHIHFSFMSFYDDLRLCPVLFLLQND